nr:hypothetical protein [uncultured Anaerocolumna sp.]
MGGSLNGTITISVNRYNELLSIETRAKVLADTVKSSKYSISNEAIATILGFEMPKSEKEEGTF